MKRGSGQENKWESFSYQKKVKLINKINAFLSQKPDNQKQIKYKKSGLVLNGLDKKEFLIRVWKTLEYGEQIRLAKILLREGNTQQEECLKIEEK